MGSRKKIDRLPQEVRDEITVLLRPPNNYTYTQIAEHLRSMGHDVSRSSVHRWEKDITRAWEKTNRIREQVSNLVTELRENPSVELTQVSIDILTSGLVDTLAQGLDFSESDPVKLGNMLASLHRAEVYRERMRVDYAKKVKDVVERVTEKTKRQLDEETLQVIQEEIYGLATPAK